MSMQTKILNAIKEVAEKNGYEFQTNPQWANTGKVHISPAKSFRDVLAFAYSFQSDYLNMQIYRGGFNIVAGMVPSTQPGLVRDVMIQYHESGKLEGLIELFRAYLPKPRKTRKSPAKA